MAATRPTRTTSRGKVNSRNNRGMYVDGNAVRRLREVPERRVPQQPKRRIHVEEPRRKVRSASESREIQRQIERNRAKATGINQGFIIFLSIICVALLVVSIQYLRLKAQITTSQKNVARMESQLTDLREENDAYYSQVTNNVDMSTIRKIAIGRLGMRFPAEDQTETYMTARSSYVRQYQDIPDSK